LRMVPQPSPVWPQPMFCCAQLNGVQGGFPQTLAVPPPPQV
jgi:hypothetical protein